MRKLTKCLSILVACLSLSAGVRAATEIVVYDTAGDVQFQGYLEDEPTLNFTETGIEFKSPSAEVSLDFTSIGEIVFNENVTPSGISMTEANRQGLYFQFTDGNTVLLGGVVSDQPVSVLALDGRQVSVHTTSNGSTVSIDLSSLSRGYYIINVGKQSFKVFKK